MRVQEVNNNNTNFQAIKRISVSNNFRKHPEQAQRILSFLQSNGTAQDFFKKMDVEISLDTFENTYCNAVLNIGYHEIHTKPIPRIMQAIMDFFSPNTPINITVSGRDFEDASTQLITHLYSHKTLSHRITEVNRMYAAEASQKAAKNAARNTHKPTKEELDYQQKELNDLINKMLGKK